VAASRQPFLVHYPHWPGEKGFHPGEELAPPAKLLAGFRWQTHELGREEINVKRQALAAHHTQFDYSASRLLPFVAANELFGDLDVPALVPGGDALNLQDLAVRVANQELEITATLARPLPEWSAVTLYVFGYRQGRLFGTMPKLAIRVGPDSLTVRDQERLLPRTTLEAHVTGTKLLARIPLTALGDPDRLFLHAETRIRATSLNQTPWWVLEMPSSPRTSPPIPPAPPGAGGAGGAGEGDKG
jgi:hypothetical protein